MKQIVGYIKTQLTTNNVILLVVMSCVAALLWFAAQPVERAWCHTDVALTYAIPVLTLIGIALIWIKKNQIFTLSRLDIVCVAWFFYVMGRAYFDASYPCVTFCLRTMQMMMLYVALRQLFTSLPIREEYIVFALVLYGLWEAWLGLGQFIHGNSRHYLYLLTGSFLNPGPYSAILAMGLVMAIYWKRTHSCKYLYLPIAAFVIILPATWSRAALLATAVCVGIIYWNEWKRWFWWVVASGIVVGLGLYFVKAGSADGRSIIYLISILNITHHPILGSGIGSFFHQYAEEMARFSQGHPDFNFQSADVLDYAFNDLLRVGVEQGIIGIAFAIAVIVLTFRALGRKGQILRMGLSTLFIFSLFSYPFELLPYQIIMVLICSYAGAYKNNRSDVWNKLTIGICLSVLYVIIIMNPVIHLLAEQISKRFVAESDYQYVKDGTHNYSISDYYYLMPLMKENAHFIFDFGKILSERGRYNDSNAVLRQGILISNAPMFYTLIGNNFRHMKEIQHAELYYKKAFAVLPNRLYPLYCLMLLYYETGDEVRSKRMARMIIAFKCKIENKETIFMKSVAKRVIIQ